jgi:hypothetical protein
LILVSCNKAKKDLPSVPQIPSNPPADQPPPAQELLPDPLLSLISGTNAKANGTDTSNITITLKDSAGVPVPSIVPQFSATDTGNTNVYGACSASDENGVSNCTLKSLKSETKILSVSSPIAFAGSNAVFTPVISLES